MTLDAILGPHDGAKFPGGCGACDAYQILTKTSQRSCYFLTYHDEWCPGWPKKGEEER